MSCAQTGTGAGCEAPVMMTIKKMAGLGLGGLSGKTRDFRDDDSGAILIFGLIAFVIMLMVGGIAVDMMRYESERVRMQGTADRAVLAAAMLRSSSTNVAPEDLVQSYFDAEGQGEFVRGRIAVDESPAGDSRTVTIAPSAQMPTTFMRLSGVDNLEMHLLSQATEGLGQLRFELVLVLDISGSMNIRTASGRTRIEELRDAAVAFVEMMYEDIPPENLTISIVPYATWVVPTPGMLDYFSQVSPQDPNGACADFVHFDTVLNSLSTPLIRRNCPTHAWRNMRPMLRSLDDTRDAIWALQAGGTTSIDLGVRYGATLFDPDMRPFINQLIANGEVSQDRFGQPYDWDEPGVYRAMILMTDGENCCFGDPNTRRAPTRAVQDERTVAACQALRMRNVSVYGVAFEAPPRGVEMMEQCASSPSHYMNGSGGQLTAAFQSIATHIQVQALRLTR